MYSLVRCVALFENGTYFPSFEENAIENFVLSKKNKEKSTEYAKFVLKSEIFLGNQLISDIYFYNQ